MVWFFFEILLEAHEHIRKMSVSPLFSQRFQGCLYCLIFDFQGSWPAHLRDSHMISASPRTVNKNFALFYFFVLLPRTRFLLFFEPHPLAGVISIFCIPSLFSSFLLLFAPFRLVASDFAAPLNFCRTTFRLRPFRFRPSSLCNGLSELSFPFQCFPYSYRLPFPIGLPTLSTLKPHRFSTSYFLLSPGPRCFWSPSLAHISKSFSFPILFFRCLLLYPIATHAWISLPFTPFTPYRLSTLSPSLFPCFF